MEQRANSHTNASTCFTVLLRRTGIQTSFPCNDRHDNRSKQVAYVLLLLFLEVDISRRLLRQDHIAHSVNTVCVVH